LGKEVAEADDQIDAHLHQVFDHRVGKLAAVPGEAAKPPAPAVPAAESLAMEEPASAFAFDFLSQPESLCQAVILNEILQRPEQRWR
jgi:hypothetical protein